jgi:hypothetical protein
MRQSNRKGEDLDDVIVRSLCSTTLLLVKLVSFTSLPPAKDRNFIEIESVACLSLLSLMAADITLFPLHLPEQPQRKAESLVADAKIFLSLSPS